MFQWSLTIHTHAQCQAGSANGRAHLLQLTGAGSADLQNTAFASERFAAAALCTNWAWGPRMAWNLLGAGCTLLYNQPLTATDPAGSHQQSSLVAQCIQPNMRVCERVQCQTSVRGLAYQLMLGRQANMPTIGIQRVHCIVETTGCPGRRCQACIY